MKKLIVVAFMVIFMLFSVSVTHAGTWFTGTIDILLVKDDGTIEITLKEQGTGNLKFARVNATGDNKKSFLATALTAVARNQTIRMNKEGGTNSWLMIEL